ncbi:carboxyltransferase domain-containing protein [Microbacterium sp. YY-01]|uniref:5-oxoprolinase subunit B/C family protein n=1 Tax=Microbacterium sp. YY-01 TaxID=3421634 RepID=UPI003D17A37E
MRRVITASDHAFLVEAAPEETPLALRGALAAIRGVTETVLGAATVLVVYDPAVTTGAAVAQRARMAQLHPDATTPTAAVNIPVTYDGADLAETAEHLGVSSSELVRRHQQAQWRVAFAGFMPGFAYMTCDDPLFHVPRKSTPRVRVPAGSVGLAGPFTGIYPQQSPGGWQLIGRTDAELWNLDHNPPALLTPGTRVRFLEAPARQTHPKQLPDAAPPAPTPAADHVHADYLHVVQALQLLVQDEGRPGYAAWGVAPSGVADRGAMRAANRAVGNAPTAAVLEAMGPTVVRCQASGVMAFAGAHGTVTIVSAQGHERVVAPLIPAATFAGDEIRFDTPAQGLRYVIAVRGGITVPPVLGSRSTDTLSGLGPAPLRAGDSIPVGPMYSAPHAVEPAPPLLDSAIPDAATQDAATQGVHTRGVATLTITRGPRDDWFTPESLVRLTTQTWQVTPQSNRVGLRLAGTESLVRQQTDELPSEAVVRGSIQVPADGQPVIFLADHPLTGGYPVIATVTSDTLDAAAQLAPGASIRFMLAGADESRD